MSSSRAANWDGAFNDNERPKGLLCDRGGFRVSSSADKLWGGLSRARYRAEDAGIGGASLDWLSDAAMAIVIDRGAKRSDWIWSLFMIAGMAIGRPRIMARYAYAATSGAPMTAR
jgi:hypothetical protein